jgi:ribosomal protein L11 methyltransferase
MQNYFTEIIITPINDDTSDIVVALLSEHNYDNFLQEDAILKAYIADEFFDDEILKTELQKFNLQYVKNAIALKNWNAQWEQDYQPVIVNNKVAIRAVFHDEILGVEKNIIITPKMSFGTGHHSTTQLMMQYLSTFDCKNKIGLDYGCGTGVLGIYASYLGAIHVDANDIDDWCVENTEENIALNNIKNMDAFQGDLDVLPNAISKYDFILANINLNILLAQLPKLFELLKTQGDLFMSGIMPSDLPQLESKAKSCGFKIINSCNLNNWSAIHVQK